MIDLGLPFSRDSGIAGNAVVVGEVIPRVVVESTADRAPDNYRYDLSGLVRAGYLIQRRYRIVGSYGCR